MRLKSWPGAIILFFVSIALLNIGLMTLAVSGYGGLLDEHPYQKGLNYDTERGELAAFADSGWTARLENSPLSLSFLDSSGAVLGGATVTLRGIRPNNALKDFEVPLTETAAGSYGANVEMMPGRWLIDIAIEYRGNRYRINRSVFVEAQTALTIKRNIL